MNFIEIDENIVLRLLERGDAVDIFNAVDTQRAYLGEWLPFVPLTIDIGYSQNFVDGAMMSAQRGDSLTYVILESGRFAGIVGLKDIDKINNRTEVGYWLSEPFQGRGLVTRSVAALLRLGFEELMLNRIQIKCAVGNTKSGNIPRRLGFVFEGVERDGELESSGEYADIEVYSILRREWEKQ